MPVLCYRRTIIHYTAATVRALNYSTVELCCRKHFLPARGEVRAGLAINESKGIVKRRHNRPLYAISEQTFLWRARENLSEKVVFFLLYRMILDLPVSYG